MKPDGLIAKDKFFPMLRHGKIGRFATLFHPQRRIAESKV